MLKGFKFHTHKNLIKDIKRGYLKDIEQGSRKEKHKLYI